MLNRVSFVVYFLSTATNKEMGRDIKMLQKQRGVAGSWPLANQHGGTTYEFEVSESWADGFNDALRGAKSVREWGRSDRTQED